MTGIICGVLDWIYNILDFILPDFGIGDGIIGNISSSLKEVLDFVAAANCIFPIDTILVIIGLIVGFRLFMFSMWCVNWAIKRIVGLIG